jgi:putative DNA primase/helicase
VTAPSAAPICPARVLAGTEQCSNATVCASGSIPWLLEGCLAWQQEGLKPPRAVMSATADYREEQDVLGRFLEDACEVSPGATTLGKDLYEAYTCWCRDAGERPVSLRELNARLDERGSFGRDRGERGVRWHGVSVRPAYLSLSRVIARQDEPVGT